MGGRCTGFRCVHCAGIAYTWRWDCRYGAGKGSSRLWWCVALEVRRGAARRAVGAECGLAECGARVERRGEAWVGAGMLRREVGIEAARGRKGGREGHGRRHEREKRRRTRCCCTVRHNDTACVRVRMTEPQQHCAATLGRYVYPQPRPADQRRRAGALLVLKAHGQNPGRRSGALGHCGQGVAAPHCPNRIGWG